MQKMIWRLRQLLPLTYRSHYRDADGVHWFAVWKMWFGRVFQHEAYPIG